MRQCLLRSKGRANKAKEPSGVLLSPRKSRSRTALFGGAVALALEKEARPAAEDVCAEVRVFRAREVVQHGR